uniref:LY6/PLAUR domain containing 6B n=1 Tax=Myripristis murdjan TaxID=586833 RepID=A0A667YQE8_9TELE
MKTDSPKKNRFHLLVPTLNLCFAATMMAANHFAAEIAQFLAGTILFALSDLIYFHVSTTPFPKSFKCFTCDQAHDNYNCNRWAEDTWCPQNTQFCMTVHHFTSHGKTKSVTKRCAAREDCYMECVSCCEGMICNIEVPTNYTNAVFAKRQTVYSSAPPQRTRALLTIASLGLSRLFAG